MREDLAAEVDSLADRLGCSVELARIIHRLERQVKELRFNTRTIRGSATLH